MSVALHAFAAAAILRILIEPYPEFAVSKRQSEAVRAERIGFLRLPSASSPAMPPAPRDGGDGRDGKARSSPRLIAPKSVPTGIPGVTATASRAQEGTGPLVGAGGPVRGITPSYSDPRVWRAPSAVATAPKSASQRLDSVIVSAIQPFVDSVNAHRGDRKPGDWTIERNGQKWGIDPQFVRLGPVSIPTAILAMLPMNAKLQGNPVMAERERTMSYLNRDIVHHANRGMNEADFRKAVRSIRERKERERAAADPAATGKDRPTN